MKKSLVILSVLMLLFSCIYPYTPDISDELKGKISARIAAKAERDFVTADRLRDEIADAGIELLDSATSVQWRYK